jgi:hypothetical protein
MSAVFVMRAVIFGFVVVMVVLRGVMRVIVKILYDGNRIELTVVGDNMKRIPHRLEQNSNHGNRTGRSTFNAELW